MSIFANVIFLLLLPVFASLASGQPSVTSHTPRFWVVLSEPRSGGPNLTSQVNALRLDWPERSLTRRLKNDCTITADDLPLSEEASQNITATGARIVCRSRWMRAVSIEADSDQLKIISDFPFVGAIIPVLTLRAGGSLEQNDFQNIPVEQLSANGIAGEGEYGFSYRQAEQSRALEIHRRGGMGRGVLIGVLDTGFQLDHRAFAGLDLVEQYDFINRDSDPSYDPRTDAGGQANHGTACLSVIGGNQPGRLIGIAPLASFALGKTEETRSETSIEEDYWIEAIEWLEWLGADVVSSSLTYRDLYTIEEMDGRAPISRAAQRAAELGMVICVSAGNAGPGPITIGAPADAEGVLAIAAVDSSGRITNFSSRGPASDGRIKPDIAAMGRQVVCVRPMSYDGYTRWNGTSLACPIVAGVAALVVEAHPDWPGRKVVEALRMSSSISFMPDETYGYGLVDAVEAVDYPSLTVLFERSVEPGHYRLDLKSKTAPPITAGLSGNAIRFANIAPGEYWLTVSGIEKDINWVNRALPGKSIHIPPSGTLFLENSMFP